MSQVKVFNGKIHKLIVSEIAKSAVELYNITGKYLHIE